jgi:hypothetical protein
MPETASSRERWTRIRRSLWQPPRPHGQQPPQRVVGPLELFYDLAVVVLVAQDAGHLAGNLSWRGLGEFAAVFTLVWIAWLNGSLHHELHGWVLSSPRRPATEGQRLPSRQASCSRY